jgi:type II secretory pathway pseudopilin PulG
MAIEELVLWVLGIVVSFILGFFTSWFFDQKQRKESRANAKILKELRQYANAEIRIGDSKDGKIVEKSDGTIAIEWKKEFTDSMGLSDSVEVKLTKGKQSG